MIWVYCRTGDAPIDVGRYICESNFIHRTGYVKSKVIKDEFEEDCWLIKTTNPQNETSVLVYRIGDEIVAIEIDDDCAVNVIEPLMKKYGFNDVKWFSTK